MPGKFPLLSPPSVRPDAGPFGSAGTRGLNPFGRGNRLRRLGTVFDKGGEYDPSVFDKKGSGTVTIGPKGRIVKPGDWDALQKQLQEDRNDEMEDEVYRAPSKRQPGPVTHFKKGGRAKLRTKARRRLPHFDFGGLFSANPSTAQTTGINSNFSTGVTNNNIASQPYMNLENQVLNTASGLSGATADQYVAGFNTDQQNAFQNIRNNQGDYQGNYNQAQGSFDNAQGTAAGLQGNALPYVQQAGQMQTGTQAFNPFAQQADQTANTTVGSYMSPYMKNAMGAVGDASNRAFTQLGGPLSQINDTFSGGSAAQFGREGHGNAVGNAVYSQQQALDQQMATMANTGYQSAMTADQADLQRQAGLASTAGQIANQDITTRAGLGQTAANIGTQATNANVSAGTAQQGLGTARQTAGLTDANALLSAGNQQQQLQQQKMSFPLQLAQYQQSLGQGWQLPTSSNFTNSGNTSAYTNQQQTPGSGSTAGQVLGGATALAGAANNIFGGSSSKDAGVPGSNSAAQNAVNTAGTVTVNPDGTNTTNAARGGQIRHFDVGGYNPTVVGIRKRNAQRKPPPSPMGPMGGMGGGPPTGMPGMPPQAPPGPPQPPMPMPPRPPGPMGPMGGGRPPPMLRRARGGGVPGYQDGGPPDIRSRMAMPSGSPQGLPQMPQGMPQGPAGGPPPNMPNLPVPTMPQGVSATPPGLRGQLAMPSGPPQGTPPDPSSGTPFGNLPMPQGPAGGGGMPQGMPQIPQGMPSTDQSLYARGGGVPGYARGGDLSSILGTLGGLAGNLIPIPILGPMIGKFAGNALGDVIGGHTDAIGSDAERDFTMGLADPDAKGGVNTGAIPGLGGLSKLIGGGGGASAANTAGSAATDAGSWGGLGDAGSAATDAGSWGGGLDAIGSAFARGGRIPHFATGSSTNTVRTSPDYSQLDDPFGFLSGRTNPASTAEFRIVPGNSPQLPSTGGGGGGSAGSTAGGIGSLMGGVASLATSLFGKDGLFAQGGKFDYGETPFGRRLSPLMLNYISQNFDDGGQMQPVASDLTTRGGTDDGAYYSPLLDSSTGLQGRLDNPGPFTMSPADRYALRQQRAAENSARATGYQQEANADPGMYWRDFARQTGRGLAGMADMAGVPGSIQESIGMNNVLPTMHGISSRLDRLFGPPRTSGGVAGREFGSVLPSIWGTSTPLRSARTMEKLWDVASNIQNVGTPVMQEARATR